MCGIIKRASQVTATANVRTFIVLVQTRIVDATTDNQISGAHGLLIGCKMRGVVSELECIRTFLQNTLVSVPFGIRFHACRRLARLVSIHADTNLVLESCAWCS